MSDTELDAAAQETLPESDAPPKPSFRGIVGKWLAALAVVLVGYFGLVPSPIDPVEWTPPPAMEMTGALAPNDLLAQAELLAKGQVDGPEDVDVDAQGRIYGGTVDGKIVRIAADGQLETFATTGGRPLGLAFDAAGNLIVADAIKGLLSIDQAGKVTTLATEADGVPFGFADDLDIAGDGTIYMSDASSKFGVREYTYDMLEGRPHGRLISYRPGNRFSSKKSEAPEVKVLLDGLYFANGIALSQNEDFVLVNETWRYRITRYWLKGDRAGTSDVFIDNLPGFPDGVSSNRKGTFWVAMFTVRNPVADNTAPWPFVRRMMTKLPKVFLPTPQPYGLILQMNEQGEIVKSYHHPTGQHLNGVTSVHEHEGYLYLGTLHNDWIGKFKLPPAP